MGAVAEEHAPTSSVQTMRGAVREITPVGGAAVELTGIFFMIVPSASVLVHGSSEIAQGPAGSGHPGREKCVSRAETACMMLGRLPK